MKADRGAITEYDLELPKAIEYFKRQLLGFKSFQSSNNESSIYDKPDVSSLPPAYGDEEKNDPDVPLLTTEYSDKEVNETDVPPLP